MPSTISARSSAASTTTGDLDSRAVWWDGDGGTITELGAIGLTGGIARDINEAGLIVGSSETASGDLHATLWRPSTTVESITEIKDLVDELLASSAITAVQAAALQTILDAALAALGGGSGVAGVDPTIQPRGPEELPSSVRRTRWTRTCASRTTCFRTSSTS